MEQSASAGKHVRWIILWFVILCGAVLTVNMVINPYGIYPFRVLKPVIWVDRREKIDLLASRAEKPELIILGSSRMMRVAPETIQALTGQRGFNLAVNHARTEDFLSLLRYCVLKLDIQPRTVIVGLDIHAFRGYYQSDNLLKYYPELSYYIESEQINPLLFSMNVGWIKFTKGLSYHQTAMSVRAVRQYLERGKWESSYKFDSLGTLVYNASEESAADRTGPEKLRVALVQAERTYRNDFASFGGISEFRTECFRKLAALCRKRGIHLVAVMLPYHPQLLKSLKGSDFERLNAEWNTLMHRLAASEGVVLVDAQNIDSFGGDPDKFYDEIHMFAENSNRMADYVLKQMEQEVHHSF
ncbi:hypothetical protein LLH00_15180 [bacterium]|nr:hypothetical protein [bacterium]